MTEVEAQLLFDEGITSSKRTMMEQMMNLDLKVAYEYGKDSWDGSSIRRNGQVYTQGIWLQWSDAFVLVVCSHFYDKQTKSVLSMICTPKTFVYSEGIV